MYKGNVICRTCGLGNEKMVPIFSELRCGTVKETLSCALSTIIIECASVMVSKGDGLPEQVCIKCANKLSAAFVFRLLSKQTDSMLRMELLKRQETGFNLNNSHTQYANEQQIEEDFNTTGFQRVRTEKFLEKANTNVVLINDDEIEVESVHFEENIPEMEDITFDSSANSTEDINDDIVQTIKVEQETEIEEICSDLRSSSNEDLDDDILQTINAKEEVSEMDTDSDDSSTMNNIEDINCDIMDTIKVEEISEVVSNTNDSSTISMQGLNDDFKHPMSAEEEVLKIQRTDDTSQTLKLEEDTVQINIITQYHGEAENTLIDSEKCISDKHKYYKDLCQTIKIEDMLQINMISVYTCDECGTTYNGLASYQVHLETKHNNVIEALSNQNLAGETSKDLPPIRSTESAVITSNSKIDIQCVVPNTNTKSGVKEKPSCGVCEFVYKTFLKGHICTRTRTQSPTFLKAAVSTNSDVDIQDVLITYAKRFGVQDKFSCCVCTFAYETFLKKHHCTSTDVPFLNPTKAAVKEKKRNNKHHKEKTGHVCDTTYTHTTHLRSHYCAPSSTQFPTNDEVLMITNNSEDYIQNVSKSSKTIHVIREKLICHICDAAFSQPTNLESHYCTPIITQSPTNDEVPMITNNSENDIQNIPKSKTITDTSQKCICPMCHTTFSDPTNVINHHCTPRSTQSPTKHKVLMITNNSENDITNVLKSMTIPGSCTPVRTQSPTNDEVLMIINNNQNISTSKTIHGTTEKLICTICDTTFSHPTNLESHCCAPRSTQSPTRDEVVMISNNSGSDNQHASKGKNIPSLPSRVRNQSPTFDEVLKISNNSENDITNVSKGKTIPRSCTPRRTESSTGDEVQTISNNNESVIQNVSKGKTIPGTRHKCICHACGKKFVHTRFLKWHTCSSAEKASYKCSKCMSCFETDGDLKQHFVIHTGEKPFKCNICSSEFTFEGDLTIHTLKHSKADECCYCFSTFNTKYELTMHMKTHAVEQLSKTDQILYKCTLCISSYMTDFQLKKHKIDHGYIENKFSVEQNNYREGLGKSVNVGENNKVTPSGCVASSGTCGLARSELPLETMHKSLNSGTSIDNFADPTLSADAPLSPIVKLKDGYQCGYCKTHTRSMATYLKHVRRYHKGKKPFKCNICDSNFHDIFQLKAHKKRHTGQQLSTCKVCNLIVIDSLSLRVHMRVHRPHKPKESHKCDVCSWTFSALKSLRKHEKIHTIEGRHKCSKCPSSFMTYIKLVWHMIAHKRRSLRN